MKTLLIILAIVSFGTGTTWLVFRQAGGSTTVFRTERTFSQTSLTATADTIVTGTFRSARSYTDRSTGNPVVLTEWTFDVARVIKGPAVKSLAVTLTGGVDNTETTKVEDALTITAGQEAQLYLTAVKERNTYIPVSIRQGIFLKHGNAYVAADGQNLTLNQ